MTLALVLLTQAVLGIATLLWHVPLSLALLHQAVAVVALVVATVHTENLHAARTFLLRERRQDLAGAERLSVR